MIVMNCFQEISRIFIADIYTDIDNVVTTDFESQHTSAIRLYQKIKTYMICAKIFDRNIGMCSSVKDFLKQADLDSQEIVYFYCLIVKERKKKSGVQTLKNRSPDEKLMRYFYWDSMQLIKNVLQDNEIDPQYSSIVARNRLKLYIAYESKKDITVVNLNDVANIMESCGFFEREVSLFFARITEELSYYHGEIL